MTAAIWLVDPFRFSGAYLIVIEVGHYTLTGKAALLEHATRMPAGQGSYALSGKPALLEWKHRVFAGQGSYVLSGKAASFLYSKAIQATKGQYTLSGKTINFLWFHDLAAVQGSYALSGKNALLEFGHKVIADKGQYSLSGQPAAFLFKHNVVAAQGAYALNGKAALLEWAHKVAADFGSYALSGKAVQLEWAHRLPASQGSYGLTGEPVGTYLSRVVKALQGSYGLSGEDATLIYQSTVSFALSAAQGSYALSGEAASFLFKKSVTAAKGTLTLSGQSALLEKKSKVVAAQGSYGLSGKAAALIPPASIFRVNTFFETASQTGALTLTGIQAGDLLIAEARQLKASTATVDTIPSGWTRLSYDVTITNDCAHSLFYKIADGTETSFPLIGASGTGNRRIVLQFRKTFGGVFTSVGTSSLNHQVVTSGVPTAQVEDSNNGPAPAIVFATYASDNGNAITARGFSTGEDAEYQSAASWLYWKYKILNTPNVLASTTISMTGGGNPNFMSSVVLRPS